MALDLKNLPAELKKVPWWGWAAGGGAALGGIYLIHKQQSATPAAQATAQPVPQGLNAADLAGLPYDYQDYSASYGNPSSPGQTGTSATVRQRYSNPNDAMVENWDKSHTGVPEHASPDVNSQTVQLDPFGGTVQLTGQQQQGTNNLPNDPSGEGSTQWYQLVDGAWISAFDLAGQWQGQAATPAATQATGGGGFAEPGGGGSMTEHSFPQEETAGVYG